MEDQSHNSVDNVNNVIRLIECNHLDGDFVLVTAGFHMNRITDLVGRSRLAGRAWHCSPVYGPNTKLSMCHGTCPTTGLRIVSSPSFAVLPYISPAAGIGPGAFTFHSKKADRLSAVCLCGSPSRTRTYNNPVNSRVLYH